MIALVRNVSDKKVSLHEKHFTLTLPPEFEDPSRFAMYADWGLFPEPNSEKRSEEWNNTVTLQPGGTYPVFWSRSPPRSDPENPETKGRRGILATIADTLASELRYLFFSPGDYKITVVGRYWVEPEKPPDGESRTLTKTTTLTISAPQFVVLAGAGFGGFLAYLILPQDRRRFVRSSGRDAVGPMVVIIRVGKEVVGLFSALALSIILTILLSRISETQFFIRVTITDLWGAIAIGFAANYVGYAGIQKLLGTPRQKVSSPGVGDQSNAGTLNDGQEPTSEPSV